MEDLSCLRTVHIETERENKKLGSKRTRLFDLRKISIKIGALTIKSLGYLHTAVSDKPQSLIPVNFQCTRIFWSTLNPYQKTKYHCRISLIVPEKRDKVEDRHLVINHQGLPNSQIDESLENFDQYVKQVHKREQEEKEREIQHKLLEQGKPIFDISSPKTAELQKFGKRLTYDNIHEEDANIGQHVNDTRNRMHFGLKISNTAYDETSYISEDTSLNYASNANLEKNTALNSDFVRKPTFSPRKPMNKAVGNVVNRTSPIKNNFDTISETLPYKPVNPALKHNTNVDGTLKTVHHKNVESFDNKQQQLIVSYNNGATETSTYHSSADQEKANIEVFDQKYFPQSFKSSLPTETNCQIFTETFESNSNDNDVIMYAGSESSCGSFADETSNTLESLSEFSNDTVKNDIQLLEHNGIGENTSYPSASVTHVNWELPGGHTNDVDVDMEIIKDILSNVWMFNQALQN